MNILVPLLALVWLCASVVTSTGNILVQHAETTNSMTTRHTLGISRCRREIDPRRVCI
jgi:hypothetical protein